MVFENAIANLQRYVGEAFKAGTAFFPYYTLHGVEHLQELDRLARLIGGAIPRLSEERLGLLRLAIAVHDFAMVDVPGESREKELRRRQGDSIALSDLIRKTHQDEIERCFTKRERLDYLMAVIPGATPGLLGDVATIAKYHRLHPLDQAPSHVRELCALMRILDELDIGPLRAPLPTYEALRDRMEPSAKLHWLKHLCSRPIDAYSTFSIEQKNFLRILRVSVVVEATESTWEPIQNLVVRKLQNCLEGELVNQVLQKMLQVEFEVAPSLSQPSGPTAWLNQALREDLDNLAQDLLCPKEGSPATSFAECQPVLSPTSPGPPASVSAPRSSREFKVIAVPPERFAEFLCKSGRLTVISNAYVVPEEDTVGGVASATSRFFVGPADSGKTRAALEWLDREIGAVRSQWVIFRTDVGTLPSDTSTIVLDRTLYGEVPLPNKAILFLDDLPTTLPSPGDAAISAEEVIRGFFRWFRELPFLRERRVVGTIRLEDVHARPEWPDVLPSLGQELELVRLRPLDEQGYSKLWEGMGVGALSRSMTRGVECFQIDLKPDFLKSVISRNANPEAVATFVQQNALNAKTVLSTEDAASFSASAVETWLRETWPAVQQAYGVTAKVFFTLTRFVEAALRPTSGIPMSMGPAWAYHEQWGPELCALNGGAAGDYLPILERLVADGHATGERGVWIRPKFDFLLQAENLSGVEFQLPDPPWFIEHSAGLVGKHRFSLGMQLSSFDMEGSETQDTDFLRGYGMGSLMFSERPENEQRRSVLFNRGIANLRNAIKLDPKDGMAWAVLGFSLGQAAEKESDSERAARLRDEEIGSYRSAAETLPEDSSAWVALGTGLWRRARHEGHPERAAEMWHETITAYRKATQAVPQDSDVWIMLGVCLGEKASQEDDPVKAAELRDEEMAAYRSATQADPNNSQAWNSLGVRLNQRGDQERDPAKAAELREERTAAYRRATQVDPNNSQAWNNLGLSLDQMANEKGDPLKASELRDEAIAAYRSATRADRNNSQAWNSLGLSLDQKADEEGASQRVGELRDEAIAAYRSAAQADRNNSQAWNSLGVRLGQKADRESDPATAVELRDEATEANRRATRADPNNSQAWLCFGINLSRKASLESDPGTAVELRDEAIEANRRATRADPNNSRAWLYLGINLSGKADKESDPDKVAELRDEELAAYRRATQADPNNGRAWNNIGIRLGQKAHQESDPAKAAELREEEMAAYRSAIQADLNNSQGWNSLGVMLGQKADKETNPERSAELRDEEIAAYRRAIQADPNNSHGWHNLGVRLGQKADKETDPARAAELREEEMSAYSSATHADPNHSQAWNCLGIRRGQQADQQSDPATAARLRNEEIAAYRSATRADPNNSVAWNGLAFSLGKKADQESDPATAARLRDEEIAAYRNATKADPNNSKAWNNLGVRLGQEADQESDSATAGVLRDEEMAAYRSATQADPNNSLAWNCLGVGLGKEADEEDDPSTAAGLRDEETAAYRSATQADPNNSYAWSNLGVRLGQQANQECDHGTAAQLREDAVAAHRSATEADPKAGWAWANLSAALLDVGRSEESELALREAIEAGRRAGVLGAGRYNLACGLALVGEVEGALVELAGCLERGEISREHVAQDQDWEPLRLDPRFQALLEPAAADRA